MNDGLKDKIIDLLEERVAAISVGQLSQNEIERAVHLIRHAGDSDKRTAYSLSLATHLALTGGLHDLPIAVELVTQAGSDPYIRHHALGELWARYMAIEDKPQALKLVALMEQDAYALEGDSEFFPAQRAFLWDKVTALYYKTGVLDKAALARRKAIDIAVAGQSLAHGAQEATECVSILGGIIKDLIVHEAYESALEVARVWNWKWRDDWIAALEALANRGG